MIQVFLATKEKARRSAWPNRRIIMKIGIWIFHFTPREARELAASLLKVAKKAARRRKS